MRVENQMDLTSVSIIAIIIGISVVGLIVRILLFKGIDKAVDNHGRRRQVNNPPREIKLSDEHIVSGNNEMLRPLRDNAHIPSSPESPAHRNWK